MKTSYFKTVFEREPNKDAVNWIKWLQTRIPELKKSHNEFWVLTALEAIKEEKK